MPSISLQQLIKEHPVLVEDEDQISDKLKLTLDMYMDVISDVHKATRGSSLGGRLVGQLILKDVKADVVKSMSRFLDHFVHVLNLTDIKGVKYFVSLIEEESILLSSIRSLLSILSTK